jgi:hypothetical protein
MATATGTATTPKTTTVPAAANSGAGGGGVIPFIRGSGLSRYKFYDTSGQTLLTNTQDLGPIPVKAFDYMRSLLILVSTTSAGGGSAVATVEDGPFVGLQNLKVEQPNGQTMYQVPSGWEGAMIHKYGGYQGSNDPRALNGFAYSTGSGIAPTFTFAIRIPFEINCRDALGSLPNKDANAPFNLYMTLNTLANTYGGSPTTPTFRTQVYLEAWDQPPTSLNGQSVETTPPNMNTLQRWTSQPIAISSGQFDAQLKRLGNYIRMILPTLRRTSSTRANGQTDWPDPAQIVIDEDTKDNISKTMWTNDIYEKWGYGAQTPGSASTADAVGGYDNGLFPYDYCHEFNGHVGHELGDLYLPTIESEAYIIRGSYGNAGTMTVDFNEVLPQGNIFT